MPATLLATLISIGGVAIGVWALTVVLSVMSGFEADLKRKILGQNAHGMLLTYGQNEPRTGVARATALAVPGVVGATPILYNEVMLSAGQNLTGAIVKGIDPASVGTVTELPSPSRREAQARGSRRRSAPGREERRDGTAPRRSARGGASPPRARKVLPGIVVGRELAGSSGCSSATR